MTGHVCHSNGRGRCAVCGGMEPPPWPVETWVCDGCMKRVTRVNIADMTDGEHVICVECARR